MLVGSQALCWSVISAEGPWSSSRRTQKWSETWPKYGAGLVRTCSIRHERQNSSCDHPRRLARTNKQPTETPTLETQRSTNHTARSPTRLTLGPIIVTKGVLIFTLASQPITHRALALLVDQVYVVAWCPTVRARRNWLRALHTGQG
jgi:hypothetical protein